jgi:hypothetical protein
MKITRKMILSMGFVDTGYSKKPTFYRLKIVGSQKDYVILSLTVKDRKFSWNLVIDCSMEKTGLCGAPVKVVTTIDDLASAISDESFKAGDKSRRKKLRNAMNVLV